MMTTIVLGGFLCGLAALLFAGWELKNTRKKLKETHARLLQSAKMASIGMLAGGVAHEINNPLIGVLNNIQLIKMLMLEKKEFSAADFRELLDIIEDSALRCAKVTRSLLDFSRSSKGVYQLVSLNEIAGKTVNLLAYEIRMGNIVVEKQLAGDIPLVSADPLLLQQAIFDIVNNACWAIKKKSGKQGGRVIIKTAYDLYYKQVIISISDNGIGMSEECRKKIFDPFFTTKPVGEGTGLGLSIVYGIIKDHRGQISVESKEGQGATFKIVLPAGKP